MVNDFIVPRRGHEIRSLVDYLFGPGRKNEHREQRVIAAADTLGIADGTRLDAGDPRDHAEIVALGMQLDAHRRMLGVQMPGGHVWHCAIALPPGETLTDQQWAQAARTSICALGFDESTGRAPCRWVAVYHGPSRGGSEHIHLAVNLVREDGTFASTWQERKKMSRVCAELEQRFRLSVVEGRAGAGMPGLSRAEIERTERAARSQGQPVEPDRVRLARIVRGCAAQSKTEADFVRQLRRAQVRVRPRFSPAGRAHVEGYSVALGGLWYGGGSLARDLTLPRLRERWKCSPQLEAEAIGEWSGRGVSRPPRLPSYRAVEWKLAAAVVSRVRRDLAVTEPGDSAVRAGVARETAGVLSAWSMRLERQRPGPMAFAADVLARAAQTPPDTPPPVHTGRVRDLRGVAMVAAAAARSDMGERMLMYQIVRLTETIATLHREQGQARRAAALAGAAHHNLTRIKALHRPAMALTGIPPVGAGATTESSPERRGRPSLSPNGSPVSIGR